MARAEIIGLSFACCMFGIALGIGLSWGALWIFLTRLS